MALSLVRRVVARVRLFDIGVVPCVKSSWGQTGSGAGLSAGVGAGLSAGLLSLVAAVGVA